jgi:hypothetical protein
MGWADVANPTGAICADGSGQDGQRTVANMASQEWPIWPILSTETTTETTDRPTTSSSVPSPKAEGSSITTTSNENVPSVGQDVVSGLSHPPSIINKDESTTPSVKVKKPSIDDNPDPEVVRLCELLADLYHELGNTRPNPHQKGWYREMRLLMTKDGPDGKGWDAAKIEVIIRWALAHHFWKTNIRSAPKLREQFDRLRMQRNGELGKTPGVTAPAYSVASKADAYLAKLAAEGES